MRGSLLTNAALYRCLAKLLATCELFAENVARVLGAAPIGQDEVAEAEAAMASTTTTGGRRVGASATTTMNAARKRQRRSQVCVFCECVYVYVALTCKSMYRNPVCTLVFAPSAI